MGLQAIAYDPDDFDLFNGLFIVSGHMLECPRCRANALMEPEQEARMFGLVNARLMRPIESGDYLALLSVCQSYLKIHGIMHGETSH